MTAEEVSQVACAMAVAALRDIAVRWRHKLNLCSCDQGWILPEIPCEIRRQEIEEQKRASFFARWDALGLGYIGPKRTGVIGA
jgi:hypothetical protein